MCRFVDQPQKLPELGIFKYRIDNVDWQLLILFPLVGLIAAVLYQSRGLLLWLAALGAFSGGIVWYLTNFRLRSAVLLAGTNEWIIVIGILGALTGGVVEFIVAVSGLLPVLIGGVIGGFLGLIIKAHSQRKMITFIILGGVFFCALKLDWDMIQFYESIGPLE